MLGGHEVKTYNLESKINSQSIESRILLDLCGFCLRWLRQKLKAIEFEISKEVLFGPHESCYLVSAQLPT